MFHFDRCFFFPFLLLCIEAVSATTFVNFCQLGNRFLAPHEVSVIITVVVVTFCGVAHFTGVVISVEIVMVGAELASLLAVWSAGKEFVELPSECFGNFHHLIKGLSAGIRTILELEPKQELSLEGENPIRIRFVREKP